jgi:hypothetical protein
VGRSDGHQRGETMATSGEVAASGEKPMAIDRSRCATDSQPIADVELT